MEDSRAVIQVKKTLIALINTIYNVTPFFNLKRIVLWMTGVKIGKNSYIHSPVRFLGFGRLTIGSNTVINPRCIIDNRGKIIIGNNVSIAHETKIYTTGHDVDDPMFTTITKEVIIKDFVCIFSNVIILPGIILDIGSVAYPGSVVTKAVGEYEIVGGNPAKIIRQRSKDLRYNLKHGFWFVQ